MDDSTLARAQGTTADAITTQVSLEGIHGTIEVPHSNARFWLQWRAFIGPAILVSVGYMDPGNWGTDLEAGARFRYGLLWVVALSSLMAIIMQIAAVRLGVVTGKDLAQACRDYYWGWTRWPLWLFCEVAIMACDVGRFYVDENEVLVLASFDHCLGLCFVVCLDPATCALDVRDLHPGGHC